MLAVILSQRPATLRYANGAIINHTRPLGCRIRDRKRDSFTSVPDRPSAKRAAYNFAAKVAELYFCPKYNIYRCEMGTLKYYARLFAGVAIIASMQHLLISYQLILRGSTQVQANQRRTSISYPSSAHFLDCLLPFRHIKFCLRQRLSGRWHWSGPPPPITPCPSHTRATLWEGRIQP